MSIYGVPSGNSTNWDSFVTVYDGVLPIEERVFKPGDARHGDLLRRYYYEEGNRLALVEEFDSGPTNPATVYIPLLDDRGTVMGVADSGGAVIEKLYYNATGLCKSFDGSGIENLRAGTSYNLGRSKYIDFGYLGMIRDRFTGKYHTHFRDYDPVHGRWLSEDPAGYADGLNLFHAYMDVNGEDPLGLSWWSTALGYAFGLRGEQVDEFEKAVDEEFAESLVPTAQVINKAEKEGVGAAREMVVDSVAQKYAYRALTYAQNGGNLDEAIDAAMNWQIVASDLMGFKDMMYGVDALQGKASIDIDTARSFQGQEQVVRGLRGTGQFGLTVAAGASATMKGINFVTQTTDAASAGTLTGSANAVNKAAVAPSSGLSIAARQGMVAARTAEHIALRSETAAALRQARATGMTPQLRAQLRVLGGDLGWAEEAQMVRMTGQGTRAWSSAEMGELLQSGRVTNYSPHHINNVADYPWLAGRANNIEIVDRWVEHSLRHAGNTHLPTQDVFINRSQMMNDWLMGK